MGKVRESVAGPEAMLRAEGGEEDASTEHEQKGEEKMGEATEKVALRAGGGGEAGAATWNEQKGEKEMGEAAKVAFRTQRKRVAFQHVHRRVTLALPVVLV